MRRFLRDVRCLWPPCGAFLGVVASCALVYCGERYWSRPDPEAVRKLQDKNRELEHLNRWLVGQNHEQRGETWQWRCNAADLAAENAVLRKANNIPPQDLPAPTRPAVVIPTPEEVGVRLP